MRLALQALVLSPNLAQSAPEASAIPEPSVPTRLMAPLAAGVDAGLLGSGKTMEHLECPASCALNASTTSPLAAQVQPPNQNSSQTQSPGGHLPHVVPSTASGLAPLASCCEGTKTGPTAWACMVRAIPHRRGHCFLQTVTSACMMIDV